METCKYLGWVKQSFTAKKKCQQPNNRTNTHDRTNAKIAFNCTHVSKLHDRQSILVFCFYVPVMSYVLRQ